MERASSALWAWHEKQNKKFYRLEKTIWFKGNGLVYWNLFFKEVTGRVS